MLRFGACKPSRIQAELFGIGVCFFARNLSDKEVISFLACRFLLLNRPGHIPVMSMMEKPSNEIA
jgi:hypothetical protein